MIQTQIDAKLIESLAFMCKPSLFVFFASFSLLTSIAFAQSDVGGATLNGTVTDASSAVISGATVKLTVRKPVLPARLPPTVPAFTVLYESQ